MKKYISFLSLIVAFVLQSCDRSDLSLNPEDQVLPKQEPTGKGAHARTDSKTEMETSFTNKTKTGDDDEPRKDKSHWRIQNDTVR